MNHSCVGNVSYSFLADVTFARVRVPVKAGTELVDSYVDGLEELDERRGKLAKHGFVCGCVLCELDEADGADARGRRKELVAEVKALTDRIHGPQQADPSVHIQQMQDLIMALEDTHQDSRSRLRPSVYGARRLLAQSLSAAGQPAAALREEVEALRVLGAELEGSILLAIELVGVPRVGDSNAVLSCLFIAQQFNLLGKADASR